MLSGDTKLGTTVEVALEEGPTATTEMRPPPNLKAQIVILVGEEPGRRSYIDKPVKIGRDPSCEIHISTPDISRVHASIGRNVAGQFVLKDLGSRNGTRVNGLPVTEEALRFGDLLAVGGSTVLLFTHDDPVQDKILQLQKMEAIGKLAGGVAHDFNNLLTVVLNNSRFLEGTEAIEVEDRRACLAEIRMAAERGADLAGQLLNFARLNRFELHEVNLSKLLSNALSLVSRDLKPTIKVVTRVEADLFTLGDESQLLQVFINLLSNAREAMPSGGTLTVESEKTTLEGPSADHLPLEPGRYLRTTVSDTGVGMDRETLSRLFEPFFTTKERGKGTGLGLSIAYGIAIRHRGFIDVSSEFGVGTTFRVYLPIANLEPRERDKRPTCKPLERAEGCLLLVEDDPLVRKSTCRILRAMGYEILEAQDGLEAIKVFEANRSRIQVVLLDMVMPNMGGEETFHALKEREPGVKVLILSGYSDEAGTAAILSAGALGYLRKPVHEAVLARAIRDLLR
jgi:signal transduction histidine kinase/CheY-like chemotaxis protein